MEDKEVEVLPAKSNKEKQQDFIQLLYQYGDVQRAKEEAGYSPTYSNKQLLKNLQDEIVDYSKFHLTQHLPEAVVSLVGILRDPTAMGNKEQLSAIREIMDRTGLIKTERVEHSTEEGSAIFILPPKKELKDERDSTVSMEDEG